MEVFNTPMFVCPDCDVELVETKHTKGLYECPDCTDEFVQ